MITFTTPETQALAHAIRRAVFMDEQGVSAEEEFDGLDDQALHLLAWIDGQAVGTARLRIVDGWGKFERIAVLQHFRGRNLGRDLVLALVEAANAQGVYQYRLGAQTHALKFYERLGFSAYGDEFMDAGIPHFWMQRIDTPPTNAPDSQ
jgi:predicted GNAT family N-acyltransferase